MKKMFFIFVLAALTLSSAAFAEETTASKKFKFTAGFDYIERQQGRMTTRGMEDGMPDDLYEDGDVLSLHANLAYKIDSHWSTDYTFWYDFIDNSERFGKNADDDDGQYITHTLRLKRRFDPFALAGKDWNHSIWFAYRNYSESSIKDASGGYNYTGFSSDRLMFNANMNTDLTEKTALDLNYKYQYRTYDNDGDATDVYQHRHYLSATIFHHFNDAWYVKFKNTLYLRQHVQSSHHRDYGEWDYTYTLGHILPLINDYTLNTELTAWGELGLWEKGQRDVSDVNQAELVFMPKIKKTYVINKDMKVNFYMGAGYVLGYNTRNNDKEYGGFEGRIGSSISYVF